MSFWIFGMLWGLVRVCDAGIYGWFVGVTGVYQRKRLMVVVTNGFSFGV